MVSREIDLVAFDMDGVLTTHPSSWKYIHGRFGVDNTELYRSYSEGEISYADFLSGDVKLWMAKQAKIPKQQIVGYMDEIPFTENLLEGLERIKSGGIKTAIVSGGVSWLADRIARSFNFDFIYSNEICTDSQNFLVAQGKIGVIPNQKDLTIKEIQDRTSIPIEKTVSIGDSDFDSSMFKRSGLRVSFNSTSPELIEKSDVTITSRDFLDVARAVIDR